MRFWRCLRPGLYAILLAPKVAVGCRCDPYRLVLRYTPRYLLNSLFSMASKNLRYHSISTSLAGCAYEFVIFLMATRTCAIAWFAAISIANTIRKSNSYETTFPMYDTSYFTGTHKIGSISIALIIAKTYNNKRFQSYLASPN